MLALRITRLVYFYLHSHVQCQLKHHPHLLNPTETLKCRRRILYERQPHIVSIDFDNHERVYKVRDKCQDDQDVKAKQRVLNFALVAFHNEFEKVMHCDDDHGDESRHNEVGNDDEGADLLSRPVLSLSSMRQFRQEMHLNDVEDISVVFANPNYYIILTQLHNNK